MKVYIILSHSYEGSVFDSVSIYKNKEDAEKKIGINDLYYFVQEVELIE